MSGGDSGKIALLDEAELDTETLMVVTMVERPYVMIREGAEGNDAYEGFAIDLLKASVSILLSKKW